jgi:hypothetical protein
VPIVGAILQRLLRSLGTAGAVENARAELLRDQERSVQACLVVRRVNHQGAPLRPLVVATRAPSAHRPSVRRAA